jgi:hypothetical protein
MRKLEWDGWPRMQMFFLVLVTGAVGLATSYSLLRAGMESMAVRYPLAVACAYGVFLVLLWLWLRTRARDYLDASFDIPQPSGGSGGSALRVEHDPVFAGGGGQSGGGGASGSFSFDDPLPSPGLPQVDVPGGDAVGDVVGGAIGGADEGAVPIIIALLVAVAGAALFFATLYIVYLAPALFAELLVDGVLSASLYRRLRGLQTRHWLESALRRTVLPFAVTALTLSMTGYLLHSYAPQAHTLGQAWHHYRSAPRQ